jgi:hypothetical protein
MRCIKSARFSAVARNLHEQLLGARLKIGHVLQL